MTVILTYKHAETDSIYMFSDSEVSNNIQRDPTYTQKIIKKKSNGHEYLIGVSGSLRVLNIIQNMTFPHYRPTKDTVEKHFFDNILTPLKNKLKDEGLYIRINENSEELGLLDDTSFLFAGQGHIFQVQPNLGYFEPMRNVSAIGSAETLAIGIMTYVERYNTEVSIVDSCAYAIEIASSICSGIALPVSMAAIPLRFKKVKSDVQPLPRS